jgi:hypothetical protein
MASHLRTTQQAARERVPPVPRERGSFYPIDAATIASVIALTVIIIGLAVVLWTATSLLNAPYTSQEHRDTLLLYLTVGMILLVGGVLSLLAFRRHWQHQ